MLERGPGVSEGVEGVLQERVVDLDEFDVGGFFDVRAEDQVGHARQDVRGQAFPGEQVGGVVSPLDVEVAAGDAVHLPAELVVCAGGVGADEAAVAGDEDDAVGFGHIGEVQSS